jgi:hypothetical protein
MTNARGDGNFGNPIPPSEPPLVFLSFSRIKNTDMSDRGCCQRWARASARRPAAAKRCSCPPGARPVVHRFHHGLLPTARGLPLRFDTEIPCASDVPASCARSRASVESRPTSRPRRLTISIALRRRSHATSSNRVYPHCVRADADAIIVAVRIKPYSLGRWSTSGQTRDPHRDSGPQARHRAPRRHPTGC